MSRAKFFREFEAEANFLGYTFVGLTAKGHWKWRHRNGALVITISNMEQTRDRKNSLRNLRQHTRRRITQRQHQEARA